MSHSTGNTHTTTNWGMSSSLPSRLLVFHTFSSTLWHTKVAECILQLMDEIYQVLFVTPVIDTVEEKGPQTRWWFGTTTSLLVRVGNWGSRKRYYAGSKFGQVTGHVRTLQPVQIWNLHNNAYESLGRLSRGSGNCICSCCFWCFNTY